MISFPTLRWQSSLVKKGHGNSARGRVISMITPRLYLSDLHTAQTAGNLERLGITHIVSAVEVDVSEHFGNSVTVMHVPIRDEVDANMAQWFDNVVKFIQDALDADERNKVLVHCLQGVSRSATLVCAYLVATTPMRANEAIVHVQAKRGIVSPNLGFRRQLAEWERQFEDTKRAEERRRKGKSLAGALSQWMGKTRSR